MIPVPTDAPFLRTEETLAEFIAAHRAALTTLTTGEDGDALAGAQGGETLSALMQEWAEGAEHGFACDSGDYAALFDAVAAQLAQLGRGTDFDSPRVMDFGVFG